MKSYISGQILTTPIYIYPQYVKIVNQSVAIVPIRYETNLPQSYHR